MANAWYLPFDGVDDYVLLGTTFPNRNAFEINMRLSVSPNQTDKKFIAWGQSGNVGFTSIGTSSTDNGLKIRVFGGGTNATGAASIFDGQIRDLRIVYNGNPPLSGTLEIFVDGNASPDVSVAGFQLDDRDFFVLGRVIRNSLTGLSPESILMDLYYFDYVDNTIGESSRRTFRNIVGPNETELVDLEGNANGILSGFTNPPPWTLYTYSAPNVGPTANAGPNQLDAIQGTTITLDGTSSSDPDGTIASYAWTQTAGTTVTLTGANTAQPTFTAPNTIESLTFELTVTDDQGAVSAPDTVTIGVVEVPPPNQRPVASAGPDITVLGGDTFTLDGSASFDVDGTIATYEWVQEDGPACTIANPNQAITTVTTPVVVNSEPAIFRLIVTDEDGDSSLPDSVAVLVSAVNEAPVANAGQDLTGINSGSQITLNGLSSTDDTGVTAYKWTQISGAYAELSNRNSATPSFVAPELTNRSAFAQDIYGFSEEITPTNIKIPTALTKLFDVNFVGCFSIAYSDANSSTAYSRGAITLSNDLQSMFVAGHEHQNMVAKFTIPIPSNSATFSDLPVATFTQPFTPLLSLNTVDPANNNAINGLLEFDGKLIATSERWYNTGDTSHNIQFLSNSSDLANSTNTGLMRLDGGSKSGGWMAKVPVSMQPIIGGEYVSGWASNYSIVTRYSQGPSLFVFDPQAVVTANAGDLVPSTELLSYPMGENALVTRGTTEVDPMWGELAQGKFGFLIPNSNYFMVMGKHGGLNDGVGYKITQDNGNVCGGECSVTVADNYNYYWLYDVNDIVNAQNVYDAKPISFGKWHHPFDGISVWPILGGTYDIQNERLYVTIRRGHVNGVQVTPNPVIVVYDFSVKAQEINTFGTDLTDLVFQLEVTDGNGLKSTDTVTVSLDANQVADTTPPVITFSPPQTVYNLTQGATFTPPTATAIDSIDGVVAVTSTGTVNTAVTGAYFLTYTATDSSGNTSTRDITVNVTDVPFNGSVLTLGASGIPDGAYNTRIVNPITSEVIFSGSVAWQGEAASVSLEGVDSGTSLEYYVIGVSNGSLDRGTTV